MKKARFLGSLILLCSFITLSCFEKFNPSESQEISPEIPKLIIFKGPNSNKTPTELQNSLKAFNGRVSTGFIYLSIATIEKPEVEGNQSTWNVSAGGFTSQIVAEKNSDESVHWKVSIDGSDDTRTFDNWVALEGISNFDGSSGSWHVFAENSTIEIGIYQWEVKENDQKEGSFSNNSSSIIYKIINKPDQSGTFDKKENDTRLYEAIWDESGAGSWQRWDPVGNVADSGGWS